jgi:thioredoxin-related protein
MDKLYKRIQFLANVAIVLLVGALGVLLIKSQLGGDTARSNVTEVVVGQQLALPGVDWAKSERTLVLALSSTCRFCTASASFYRNLSSERQNVRLIAVLPQAEAEARKYLNDLNVPVDEVKQFSLPSLGVKGTPTIFLVDRAGVVVDKWRGKLPESQEREVVGRLKLEPVGD